MDTNETLVEGAVLDQEQDASIASAKVESVETVESSSKNQNEETGTHQEHIQAALELLYVHFPKAFIKEGNCKPLKIGILEDLKGRITNIEGLSISKIRAAVRVYTTRLRYFYCMREGAKRIDLDGVEVDVVSAEHAEYARNRFTEINNARRPAKKPKFRRRPGPNQSRDNNNANRDNNRPPRRSFTPRFVPAKESDIVVGRTVFVSTNRNYEKCTVAEEIRGDKVNITLNNGLSVITNLNKIFIGTGNPNNRPNFRRNNNGANNNGNNNYKRRYPNNQGRNFTSNNKLQHDHKIARSNEHSDKA